jgi:hypothetical protein
MTFSNKPECSRLQPESHHKIDADLQQSWVNNNSTATLARNSSHFIPHLLENF